MNTHYLCFLRDIYEEILSIEDADKEQINLFHKLKNVKIGKKPEEKIPFVKNARFLLNGIKILN